MTLDPASPEALFLTLGISLSHDIYNESYFETKHFFKQKRKKKKVPNISMNNSLSKRSLFSMKNEEIEGEKTALGRKVIYVNGRENILIPSKRVLSNFLHNIYL